ncbi:DUF4097 family beta strand repeat-containing protein [Mycolicibacterium monacense]|uniref:DUF4097 domain-containing protein n=1 Tax=Mycolicibacterium monacense TaxID=85693 RepID=A0AAD1IXI6_MYCMB|nr:DUF4097 family beta strand repeat-containing protein [Mycolicibacterium monacense]MDA4101852.1 hypothetical protein [Mycolicibacterium monacense DSM 44395]OBB66580.1 hypothetical protein A6B34_21400 [Mycolicibacterium monacense]ORB12223.1 hypothetical protein BST34_27405 [Mycolicibacterium monacense DSM 44395]QHP84792.1 hypothetical protein EWR22_05135 [Mycolicibacterium monacense DSM 44395]BBZ62399.1 hypothetical protein MMON_37000 [Mycolicibacterium monacense]
MPEFHTPDPVTAVIDVVAGSVHLATGERSDTVVEIRPKDPSRASDVRAAEHARVDFRHGKLTVSAGPKFVALGRGGAVSIDVAMPAHSRLQASSASAGFDCDGVLGDCRFSSAGGDARFDVVEGKLKADTASGDITARSVTGNVTVSTASGDATIGRLDGDLGFKAASGALTVERLRGTVRAQTASGDVSVAAAVSGAVTVTTGSGDVGLGIPEGTAARLDVHTRSGALSSTLDVSSGPADDDETLTVHARTGSGDITVRRAVGIAN